MSEEPNQLTGTKKTSFDVLEMMLALWKSRKQITYVVGIITALAIIISLLLPPYFRSTAVILPDTEKSKLGSLGGLSDLASLAGVSTGEASMVKLYPTIIKSEAVLKNVLYARYQTKAFSDSVNLIEFWKIKAATSQLVYETALKTLRDQLEVSMDQRTNVVSISIETKESQLSADVVNRVTSELDEFIRTKRTTSASEQRKWIEARLAEVKLDLEKSENALKDFREENSRVADSPRLLLEQERLIREVQINATLYTELKKQNEIVKIEEIKNIPIVYVMDPGRLSEQRERPRKTVIVVSSFLISLFVMGTIVVVQHQYKDSLTKFADTVRRWYGENFSLPGRSA